MAGSDSMCIRVYSDSVFAHHVTGWRAEARFFAWWLLLLSIPSRHKEFARETKTLQPNRALDRSSNSASLLLTPGSGTADRALGNGQASARKGSNGTNLWVTKHNCGRTAWLQTAVHRYLYDRTISLQVSVPSGWRKAAETVAFVERNCSNASRNVFVNSEQLIPAWYKTLFMSFRATKTTHKKFAFALRAFWRLYCSGTFFWSKGDGMESYSKSRGVSSSLVALRLE